MKGQRWERDGSEDAGAPQRRHHRAALGGEAGLGSSVPVGLLSLPLSYFVFLSQSLLLFPLPSSSLSLLLSSLCPEYKLSQSLPPASCLPVLLFPLTVPVTRECCLHLCQGFLTLCTLASIPLPRPPTAEAPTGLLATTPQLCRPGPLPAPPPPL